MRRKTQLAWLLFITGIPLFAGEAIAEKARMSPKQNFDTATDVVTGQVVAVYHRKVTRGEWDYTHSIAEFRIETVEKGDSLKEGGLVYARYWTRRWTGKGRHPTSTSGHWGVPKAGDPARVYLARNAYDGFTRDNHDGGYNVIGGNGWEISKPKANQ